MLAPTAPGDGATPKSDAARAGAAIATRYTWCGVCCLVLCAVGVVLATVIHDVVHDKLQAGLKDEFVLSSPSAGNYAAWADSDNPDAGIVMTTFYVYNVTNAWDVVMNGATPNITQFGPLNYRYNQKKYNVTWDGIDDGDELTYNMWQYYTAADDATRALESMTVTTLNVPFLGVLGSPLVATSTVAQDALSAFVLPQVGYTTDMSLWINKTMYEVIWGWDDALLFAVNATLSPITGQPSPVRYPAIQENDSSLDAALAKHGPTRMYTGKYTANLAREFLEWDGMDAMTCCLYGPCGDTGSGSNPVYPWTTPEAQQIRGTFGDQFHLDVSPDETLWVSTHGFGVFRQWPLVSDASTLYSVQGISLYRYTFQPDAWANASVNPSVATAYSNFNGPSGVLNLSACEWGAPIYVSQPLFLDGTSTLATSINGLGVADFNDHGTYLGVEPYSGKTLDFHWRVGVNAYVHNYTISTFLGPKVLFANVAPVYLPMAWVDRYASIDSGQATTFKNQVYVARDVMLAARWGGVAVAALGFLLGIAFFYFAHKRRKAAEKAREMEAAKYYGELYRPFLAEAAVAGGPSGGFYTAALAAGGATHALPPGLFSPDRSIMAGDRGMAEMPSPIGPVRDGGGGGAYSLNRSGMDDGGDDDEEVAVPKRGAYAATAGHF